MYHKRTGKRIRYVMGSRIEFQTKGIHLVIACGDRIQWTCGTNNFTRWWQISSQFHFKCRLKSENKFFCAPQLKSLDLKNNRAHWYLKGSPTTTIQLRTGKDIHQVTEPICSTGAHPSPKEILFPWPKQTYLAIRILRSKFDNRIFNVIFITFSPFFFLLSHFCVSIRDTKVAFLTG